jgi:hypothetical protein
MLENVHVVAILFNVFHIIWKRQGGSKKVIE